ncbi:tetratricopeptide repeat protein [Aquifex sp.]
MKRKSLLVLPFILAACAPVAETSKTEQRLNELEIRVAKLEEKQEEINLKLEEINKRIDLLTEEVGRLKLAKVTRRSYEEKPKVTEEKPVVKEPSEDEKIAYEEALSLFNEGKLIEARDAFLEFLKKFEPNKYTDNAYFWLGKIYYELGKTEKARQIFNALIKKCEEGKLPDCNKLPDTYFMLVKMAVDEGDVATANKYLALMEEKFPQSEATQRAKALLYKEP